MGGAPIPISLVFPDTRMKFPATPKTFPAQLRRELTCKCLIVRTFYRRKISPPNLNFRKFPAKFPGTREFSLETGPTGTVSSATKCGLDGAIYRCVGSAVWTREHNHSDIWHISFDITDANGTRLFTLGQWDSPPMSAGPRSRPTHYYHAWNQAFHFPADLLIQISSAVPCCATIWMRRAAAIGV